MRTQTLLMLFVFRTIESAKILGIFPTPSPNHYSFGNVLLKGLAESKGHEVTMIGCFSDKSPPKNGTYKEIVLTELVEGFEVKMKSLRRFEMGILDHFVMFATLNSMFLQSVEKVIVNPEVQQLIECKETFDVVIVEHFMNEAHKAFANHFGAQLIVAIPHGANSLTNYLVGNPTPLSYVPSVMLDYSSSMTFDQRVLNVLMYLWEQLIYTLYTFPQQSRLVEKYFPGAPPLIGIMHNTSIVLLNSHQSIDQAVPHVPSMIEVGGCHVKPPQKLPKNLQHFLDEASDGVIYFSLGSHNNSTILSFDKRQAILNAFSKLNEKILWKLEEETLSGWPPNVKIVKWIPEQDIIAHPNIKLFITSASMSNTILAVYHGVPILELSDGGDELLNVLRKIDQEFGLILDYETLTEETFTEKLNELLINPKYFVNAKLRSSLFHDRPVSPLDTAIYWIEYVIRNGGATHFKVEGVNLPWYKYHLLDIIAYIILIRCFYLCVIYLVCRKLYPPDIVK